jgi:hypothetical protein
LLLLILTLHSSLHVFLVFKICLTHTSLLIITNGKYLSAFNTKEWCQELTNYFQRYRLKLHTKQMTISRLYIYLDWQKRQISKSWKIKVFLNIYTPAHTIRSVHFCAKETWSALIHHLFLYVHWYFFIYNFQSSLCSTCFFFSSL